MEITKILNLSSEQESLLDMHGLLNMLNVINHELIFMSQKLKSGDDLLNLIDDVSNAAELLKHPEKAAELVQGIDQFIEKIEAALDEASRQIDPTLAAEIRIHRDNLKTIESILRLRAQEILIRHQSADKWVSCKISDIKGKIVGFLSALEKNSHGRYRIVHNIAEQQDGDYLIHFEITTDEGESILMPIIFQDVMRDLIANARKYTPLGGKIEAGLHATHEGLRFVVHDNGIGIPADSIEEVVLFGKRARNVQDHETRGGGFGLTKAYCTARKYGGRMWIDSRTAEEGDHGTKVEIWIPYL